MKSLKKLIPVCIMLLAAVACEKNDPDPDPNNGKENTKNSAAQMTSFSFPAGYNSSITSSLSVIIRTGI